MWKVAQVSPVFLQDYDAILLQFISYSFLYFTSNTPPLLPLCVRVDIFFAFLLFDLEFVMAYNLMIPIPFTRTVKSM